MTITRRRFVRNLSAAALAAVSLSSTAASVFSQTAETNAATDGLFPVPPESAADALNFLTRAHFEPFVNTFVEVYDGEIQVARLRIIEVTELKRANNEKRSFTGESFSLLFQDTRRARLAAQTTYRIQHFALGEFSLLLSPTGLKGNRYEAIINRVGGGR
ncbi:MAG: hypothetical protein M3384_18695 [Acidobacteriota bacterium]|nr:hypothetical protein [Acidobacteriota bacterium]